MVLVKNPPANAGDAGDQGSIPGSGRSPGAGNGNPLHCSCLEGPKESDTTEANWQVHARFFQRDKYKIFNTSTCKIKKDSKQKTLDLISISMGFRKGRGTRDQTSLSALLTMPKPLTVWITTNCGKF